MNDEKVNSSIVTGEKTKGHENKNSMAEGQFYKEEIFFGFSKNVYNQLMCERKN